MLEVKSLIEKEIELNKNVQDQKRAVESLRIIMEEFTKKKSENIRFILCGEHG